MSDNNASSDISVQTLQQLGEVKGQLANITLLIQSSQIETHRRIDDLRTSMETRFDGVEERLTRVEENERATAMRAAGSGAITGAIVAAGIEFLAHKLGG